MKKIKVRLTRKHYLNGIERRAGAAILVDQFTAEWLVEHKRAVVVKTQKPK